MTSIRAFSITIAERAFRPANRFRPTGPAWRSAPRREREHEEARGFNDADARVSWQDRSALDTTAPSWPISTRQPEAQTHGRCAAERVEAGGWSSHRLRRPHPVSGRLRPGPEAERGNCRALPASSSRRSKCSLHRSDKRKLPVHQDALIACEIDTRGHAFSAERRRESAPAT
jgi:hypothetical protein